jgi:hypothetical protein
MDEVPNHHGETSQLSRLASRFKIAFVGLSLAGLGGLLMWFVYRAGEGGPTPAGLRWLNFVAPLLFMIGAVTFAGGLIRGGRFLSRRSLLITALVMLTIGGCPWVYTQLIIHDRGGEGSGMLGTLIFILLGIPGALLLLLAIALYVWAWICE